jgi:hypothetical protein
LGVKRNAEMESEIWQAGKITLSYFSMLNPRQRTNLHFHRRHCLTLYAKYMRIHSVAYLIYGDKLLFSLIVGGKFNLQRATCVRWCLLVESDKVVGRSKDRVNECPHALLTYPWACRLFSPPTRVRNVMSERIYVGRLTYRRTYSYIILAGHIYRKIIP